MEKNSILFIRSFTPDFDGKFNKYQTALSNKSIPWYFLGWDRSGDFQSKYAKQSYFYRRKALIGGGWKNLFNIILWNFFAATFLWRYKKQIKALHIIDFDSAILTFPLAKLLKKKVVFDVYDKYTSMRNFPKPIKKTIDSYEKLMLRKADITILADESRLKQHNISKTDNLLILENVPAPIEIVKTDLGKKRAKDNFSIGYFGVLEKTNRGLEDTIQAILASKNWELHVAGYGELENYFKEMAHQYPDKIKFYGPQESTTGLSIMSNVDIILGLYYRNIPNHLYAAPNKYFEHLMLGKPFLTTIGTPPGDKVTKFNTGWAIEEGSIALSNLLNSITLCQINNLQLNAKHLWRDKYSSYFSEYTEKYTHLISFFNKN